MSQSSLNSFSGIWATDNITYLLSDSIDVLVATSGTKSRTQFYIKGRWGYVKITNLGSVPDTIILKTLYTLNNNDGTLTQPSYSNASNLITETLATLPVFYLTIGNWYRVATVGITTGAQWNAIGAIVAGESIPSIGRLFQCLAIGPNVGGMGTCYDVEYNTNLITETLATLPVFYLIIGNWYRVATVGITTGAQWNAIGAIVAGESIPSIGRLFQCLAIGPNVAGMGTCYDVEYNTNSVVSGSVSVSNFPAVQTVDGTVKITDTYGGTIATTAGNLMIGIGNIYTANPLHTIVDSGIISLSNSLNTATYNSGPIVTGPYISSSFDLNENSLFDCLLYATGIIVSGNIRLEYSVDNINFIPNNTTSALAPLSTTDPHFVYLGVKSGSRYVRVSTGVAFTTTVNLQIIFSSKRN